jgi:hypothetical protein
LTFLGKGGEMWDEKDFALPHQGDGGCHDYSIPACHNERALEVGAKKSHEIPIPDYILWGIISNQ